MDKAILGIIGGSGLYDLPELENRESIDVETPFGPTSSPLQKGWVGDTQVVFLARHGIGHRFTPSEVPYRANIYAMKKLGVTQLLGVSAVGSLDGEIHPGHLAVPSQLIDRTKGIRPSTFFEKGIVAHVVFADPYCKAFSSMIAEATRAVGPKVHLDKTLVCMEGPQFSTRAESHLYRSWGAHLIGMTALPEAKLAREASLCYGGLALATDFDCWHESEEDVTVAAVIEVMKKNTEAARKTILNLTRQLSQSGPQCLCHQAMANAIVTSPEMISEETRERLAIFL